MPKTIREADLASLMVKYLKLTSTISPFLVTIVVVRYSAPWSIVVFRYATVVTTTFVSERERAAVTRCRSLSALACKE